MERQAEDGRDERGTHGCVKPSQASQLPRLMTPEQFAYWVRGIADSGAPTTLGMLDAILAAARRMS